MQLTPLNQNIQNRKVELFIIPISSRVYLDRVQIHRLLHQRIIFYLSIQPIPAKFPPTGLIIEGQLRQRHFYSEIKRQRNPINLIKPVK